jgi:hypothetical protein
MSEVALDDGEASQAEETASGVWAPAVTPLDEDL